MRKIKLSFGLQAIIVVALVVMVSVVLFINTYKTLYYIDSSSIDNSKDSVVAFSAGEGYTGRFPDIVQTTDKDILVAFYWNNLHAPDVLGDSLGSIHIVRGEFNGDKFDSELCFTVDEQFLAKNNLGLWTDGTEYYHSEAEAKEHNADFCVEARDPNFTMMNGKIILTFFTRLPWNSNFGGYTYLKYDEDSDYTYGRTYIMYSEDNGDTWSSPTEVKCDYLDRGCAKRGNIAVMDKNTLLIPLYGYSKNMGNEFTTANVLAVLKDGQWQFQAEYNEHFESGKAFSGAFAAGVSEVSFTKVDNSLYALCRPNGDVLVSNDYGKRWENVETFDNNNLTIHQPSLFTIKESNQILASWSEPNDIGGRDIFAYIFRPNDVWRYDAKCCIYKNDSAGDMGDPTSIFLDDGSILTVYYDVQKGIVALTKTRTVKVQTR